MAEALIDLFDKVLTENQPFIKFSRKVKGSWKSTDVQPQVSIGDNLTADDVIEVEKMYEEFKRCFEDD